MTVWVPNPGQSFVIDDAVLDLFPRLQVVATPSTGSNHIDRAACERRGVVVYSLLNNRRGLDRISASAEFTFLLLLNALRRLDRGLVEVAEGRWRSREEFLRGRELAEKQVGLVGFGRIGRRLARYCMAFEARVAYSDPYVSDAEVPSWPIERIFSDADAICICCALTPETSGMIGRALLERLKPGAVLVNTSRGEILDEAALASLIAVRPDLKVALDVLAGEVRGATDSSPLMPFQRTGQIIITPHIAGASVESQRKAAIATLEILQRHYTTQMIRVPGSRGEVDGQ
jgi:phosphoglycerate dehydrogenase-like enzyme